MQFEATQYPTMVGSLNIDQAFKDKALFGSNKDSVNAVVQEALLSPAPTADPVYDSEASTEKLPELFATTSKTAEKLRDLRKYSKENFEVAKLQQQSSIKDLDRSLTDLSLKGNGLPSNRQLHERLLVSTLDTKGFPKKAQVILDHAMLLRSKEKYLFDYVANRDIVADDPWLRELWDWVAGMHLRFPIAFGD